MDRIKLGLQGNNQLRQGGGITELQVSLGLHQTIHP